MPPASLTSRCAFASFLCQVHDHIKDMDFPKPELPWFRGHSSTSHTLLPSLFRPQTLKTLGIKKLGDKPGPALLRLESDLFFEFQSRLNREKMEYESAWDLLFLMRHFGLPTRTLDWTETLGVALYFALSDHKRSDPPAPPDIATIWILNPFKMNKDPKSWRYRDTILPKFLAVRWGTTPLYDYDDVLAGNRHKNLPFDKPVAICPSRSNERMQSQAGSFTIHGNNPAPLEAQFDDSVVRSIQLPADAYDGANAFLKEAGLTTRILFPGLDGLAREMLERFR